ncbi:MAG: alpha/beta fold hydrolase [Saprospiraceae bacterium]
MRLLFGFFLLLNITSYGQKTGFAPTTDHQIFFKQYGDGEPLLIINGGPGMNSEGFSSMAEQIAALGFQTFLYDQRGTGKSTLESLDSNSVNMDLMVEDIEALRKHLKIKDWHILGHSFGGMLAAYYTTKYPEKVKGLIFSSSGGIDLEFLNGLDIRSHLSEENQEKLRYWSEKIAAGDTSFQARLERGKALAPAYLFDQSFVPVIAERLTQGNMTINALVWADLRKMQFDTKPQLQSFKKPVLVIQGKNDVLETKTAENIAKTFPNSELVFLENCAHYGWLDAKEKYFDTIDNFLKSDE